MAPRRTVPVIVPVALEGPFTYRVPEGMEVEPGSLVRVPFGPRQIVGCVWDGAVPPGVGDNRLRDIECVFDVPPLTASLRRFIDWIAHWYLMPRGSVFRMVVRVPEALEAERPLPGVALVGPRPERLTPARHRVLALFDEGQAWTRGGLAASAAVSSSVIDGLIKAGVLAPVEIPPPRAVFPPEPDYLEVALTPDQTVAADALLSAVSEGRFAVSLIDGVTGSGKTEVYLEAVAAAVKAGRQVAILLPEIALTGQFLARFEARFGARPAEWHSDVPPRQRARVWRGVATGEVDVVVGARSALFLPFQRLGLVVVDEEHDSAYKQEDRVPYNARDMAVVRGHLGGFPVVLASATPSIESRANADQGRYRRLVLPSRVGEGRLPRIDVIDLRNSKPAPGRFLAPALTRVAEQTLDAGRQVMFFLNRRGYAPLTLCRSCGHRFQCPNCTTWMVEHRFRNQLMCHLCGHNEPTPTSCPACGDVESLVPVGPGVERIAEEVAETFPGRHVLVLSSDLPGGTRRLKLELDAVAKGEADIVIGTQLVAKGHNFPFMAMVGVVDADLGLGHGDPRAAERTYQMLAQVTGRAGRFEAEGRALIQTRAPEHPVIQAIARADAEGFYRREMDERRQVGLPPFGRLAAVLVTAETRAAAAAHANAFAQARPTDDEVHVFGPAEAPIAVIRGQHRFRLLAQAPRAFDLQGFLRRWQAGAPKERGSVRVQIDVDPQSFL